MFKGPTRLQATLLIGSLGLSSLLLCTGRRRTLEKETVSPGAGTGDAGLYAPNFEESPSLKWRGVDKRLFPLGAPPKEKVRLDRIKDFCREKGVDLLEAVDIASQMRGTSAREKLDALTVVSFLVSLQKEGEDSFYHAVNDEGEKDNELFIGTVLAKIKEGKLKIRDGRKKGFSVLGRYDGNENAIVIMKDPDLSDLLSRGVLLHEIYHFYQDIRRERLSRLEVERQAYLREGEYFIYAEGLPVETSPKALENFILTRLGKFENDRPERYAVAVVHFQQVGDKKAAAEWSQRLEDSIAVGHLESKIGKITPIAKDDALERFEKFGIIVLKEKDVPFLEREIAKKRQELKSIITQVKNGNLQPDLLDVKVHELLARMVQLICTKKIVKVVEEAELSKRRTLVINFTYTYEELQPIFTELAPINSTAYVYDQFDGVD